MELDALIEKIVGQLQKNGFPVRKVSFPAAAIEAFCRKNDYDPENVFMEMEDNGIFSRRSGERWVFSGTPFTEVAPDDFLGDAMKDKDSAELRRSAESMLSEMTPGQRAELEERIRNLSPDERQRLLELAQSLGYQP